MARDGFALGGETGVEVLFVLATFHVQVWTELIELMRHPEVMKDVVAELDDLYADGPGGPEDKVEISFQALRSMGPNAKAALPELAKAVRDGDSPAFVIRLLGNLGPDALPACGPRFPEIFPLDSRVVRQGTSCD